MIPFKHTHTHHTPYNLIQTHIIHTHIPKAHIHTSDTERWAHTETQKAGTCTESECCTYTGAQTRT